MSGRNVTRAMAARLFLLATVAIVVVLSLPGGRAVLAVDLLTQNFDSDPVNYAVTGAQAAGTSYFALSNNPGITLNTNLTGASGVYFTGQAAAANPCQLTFDPVSLTGYTSPTLSIALAGATAVESDNFLRAYLDTDGNGTYETTLFNFFGNSNSPYHDSSALNLGDLGFAFKTFPNLPLPTGDGTIRLRVEWWSNSVTNENVGIDSIAIAGTSLGPLTGVTWNGTTDATWADGTNWSSTPFAPGDNDVALFNNAGNGKVVLSVGTASVGSLAFDSASAAGYTIGASAGAGTISLTGASQTNPTVVTITSSVTTPQVINSNLNLADLANFGDNIYTISNGGTGGLTIAGGIDSDNYGNKTLAFTGSGTTTVSGIIAATNGTLALSKSGSGTLILSGINTYAGTTTVAGGELHLNATGGPAIPGNLTINSGTVKLLQADQINAAKNLVVGGGTLDIQGFTQTVANVQLTAGSINGSGGTLTSANAFDVQAGSVSANLAGSVALNKNGSGTVTLSGANTYTGRTRVYAGTLQVASIGNAGEASAVGAYPTTDANGLALSSGTVLKYTGGTAVSNRGVSIGNDWGSATIQVATAGASLTLGNLTRYDAKDNRLNVTGGAANTNLTFTTITNNNNLYFTNDTNTSLTLDSMTGIGSSEKNGAGVMYLRGANTSFSGSMSLTQGVLNISDDNNLGTGALNFNNGTLQFATGSAVTLGANRLVLVDGTNTAYVDTSLADGTIASAISGSGNLTKNTAGTLTLSGANTFTGKTTVSGGILKMGNSLALQNSTYVTTGSNGTTVGLDVNGYTALTLGGLSGAVNVASAIVGYSGVTSLTLSPLSGSQTYSGAIANGAPGMTLTKKGGGTQILSGTNTYTGATTVNAGLLRITGSLGSSSAVAVTGGAIGGSGDGTTTGVIGGSVTLSGGSSIDLRDSATGTLTLGNSLGITGAARGQYPIL